MILAYGLPILTQHTKVRKNIDYIRTRFTFLFQMFFLLVSYLLSELRYNGEVRKFNEAIEKLRQEYEKLEKEGYDIIETPQCFEEKIEEMDE